MQQHGEKMLFEGLKKNPSKTCEFPHVPQTVKCPTPNVCLELQENPNHGSRGKPGNIWVSILPLCQEKLKGGVYFLG